MPFSSAGKISWTGGFGVMSAAGISPILPSCGISVTSPALNTNRTIVKPSHWSNTQPKPSAVTVATNGLVGNGSSVVFTRSSGDFTAEPGFRVGGRVSIASMTDGTANVTDKVITAVSALTVTYTDTYNSTTDGGTITSRMVAEPAQGSNVTEPDSAQGWCNDLRFRDAANNTAPAGTAGIVPSYAGFTVFNTTGTYMILLDPQNGYHGVFNTSDQTAKCTFSDFNTAGITSEARSPRWSKLHSDRLYFVSGNALKYMAVDTSCTVPVTVHTFSEYTTLVSIGGPPGGGEGDLILSTGNEELVAMVGCDASDCLTGDAHVFLYNITTDTKGTVRDVSSEYFGSGKQLDNVRPCPSGKMILQGDTGPTLEILYLNSDATTNRTISTGALYHTGSCVVDASGDEVFVAIKNDSTGPTGCTIGVVKVRASDSTQTCLWSLSNADSGGGSNFQLGNGHVSTPSGYWSVVTLPSVTGNENDATLQSYWLDGDGGSNEAWSRGSGEIILVKHDGTTAYRLVRPRCVVFNSTSEKYRWNWKASASQVLTSDTTGTVPKYVAYSCHWPTDASTGDNVAHTNLVTVR